MLRHAWLRHLSLVSALLAIVGCATTQDKRSIGESFSFAVIADLGYLPPSEPELERVVEEVNGTPLSFVVHLGDLGAPRFSCGEELRKRRLAQFQASAHPLIFTPGDNDWTDCHEAHGVKGHDPEERLSDLRAKFFAGPNTLGKRTFVLERQSDSGDQASAKYRENVRWSQGGVTFIVIHLVGSNNNRGRTAETDAEYEGRTRANIKWLQDGMRHAKTSRSRAVMVLTHANMFFENTPVGDGKEVSPSGFADIRAAIAEEALAYDKPFLLVHGDTHYFRIDKPLRHDKGKPRAPLLANFTRVEAFGYPNHHWLHVTVDDDPNVFTFRPRIVAGNVRRAPAKP